MPIDPKRPWKAWRAHAKGARAGEPESIHQLRLAARRLRAARESRGAAVPKSLRRLLKELGEARDWDLHEALLLQLPGGPAEDAARERLLGWIRRRREKSRRGLKVRLRGAGLRRCRRPAAPEPGLLARLLAELEGLGEDAPRLHELRRALKRIRFALEWREPETPFLEPLRALLWALGLHRDWGLLEALLESRAARWRGRGLEELAAGLDALRRGAAARRAEAYGTLELRAEQLRRLPLS